MEIHIVKSNYARYYNIEKRIILRLAVTIIFKCNFDYGLICAESYYGNNERNVASSFMKYFLCALSYDSI